MNTKLKVSAIMLGVKDVGRAKKFYLEGLGCEPEQDYGDFVMCTLADGSSKLALYGWDAVADDAGVPSEGSGFRGFSLHHITETRDEVDEVMQAAEAAGATVIKAAEATDWGGYTGFFSDPDGYVWKVTCAS